MGSDLARAASDRDGESGAAASGDGATEQATPSLVGTPRCRRAWKGVRRTGRDVAMLPVAAQGATCYCRGHGLHDAATVGVRVDAADVGEQVHPSAAAVSTGFGLEMNVSKLVPLVQLVFCR